MPVWKDMPIGSIILDPGNSIRYRTGDWAISTPIHTRKTSPCNDVCPAGLDVQGFIAKIVSGDYVGAWGLIKERSPFPGIIGHLCNHPCEGTCNRGWHDEPIAIHELERFVASYTHKHASPVARMPWREERVAVVGSGPCGLSCAYHLARRGFQATVFESSSFPGGTMRAGISEYPLLRPVLDREIADIESLGVRIVPNTNVGRDITLDGLKRDYQAVFIATGVPRIRCLGIPGEDAEGVMTAVDFLQQVHLGRRGFVWESDRVAVVGGGIAAVAAARCALLLGAKPVIVYRRSRDEMPADAASIEQALAEGVEMLFLAAPARILTDDRRVSYLRCVRTQLGEPDASGRRRPEPVLNLEFDIDVAGVISAIGHQIADIGLRLSSVPGGASWIATVVEDEATLPPGVFVGGDVVTGASSIVQAVAAGRRAADTIVAYVDGESIEEPTPLPLATFDLINTAYFPHRPQTRWQLRRVEERSAGLAKVGLGYSEAQACTEAERCFSCGVCNLCGNCWVFCPDVAVAPVDGREMASDLEYCKGCGICAKECPRGVIEMQADSEV